MRVFKKGLVLSALFMFLSGSEIQAQFQLGAHASITRVGGYGLTMPGIGLRSDFMFKQEHPVYISLNYNFPYDEEYVEIYSPVQGAPPNTPDLRHVTTENISFFTVMGGYSFYSTDRDESGLYGFLEAGLGFLTHEFNSPGISSDYGGSGGGINFLESVASYYLGFGGGYQLVLDNDHKLYFEGRINGENFTFNSQTGAAPQSLPFSAGLRVGYNIAF